MKNSISEITVGYAVFIGFLVVNGPVLALLIGTLFIVAKLVHNPGSWGPSVFACGFVAAWLYWSLSVPRWRLWAYQRVSNIGKLKKAAVSAGLIWRKGHFFERTEIMSSAQAAKLKELERAKT
jgi:hypothetical protein